MCCGVCDDDAKAPTLQFATYKQRSCTDILILLLYVASWFATIVLISSAAGAGADPNSIIRGVDIDGNICGKTTGFEDRKLAGWIYPTPQYFDLKVCVADCAETETDNRFALKHETTKFLFYCLPTFDNVVNGSVSIQIEVTGDFESASRAASRAVGDLFVAWPIIFASAFIALVWAFIYIAASRIFAKYLVWGMIIVIIAGGGILGGFLFKRGAEEDDEVAPERAKALKIAGGIVLGITALFFLVVFALRQRIRIAIEVVREASRAISDVKSIVFFPIIPFFVAIGYFAFWIFIAIYIFSVGEDKEFVFPDALKEDAITGAPTAHAARTSYVDHEFDESYKGAMAFHFFNLLWNTQVFIYFTYMVVAGAISQWYFTRRDDKGRKLRGSGEHELPHWAVYNSCKRTCRFHMGTICFGALLIAIIQFIRVIVHYIEKKTRTPEPNPIQKAIFCAIKCCLWCAECCLDKISKNAFVWTAIWGDSFVTACCSAFKLLWSNLARVAAISVVGTYLIFLGKLIVALLTTGVCGLILTTGSKYKEELQSPLAPLLVIFILAFLVSTLFMTMFETTVDTVFLCFLVDESFNKQSNNMYGDPDLVRLVNKYQVQSQEKAKRDAKRKEVEL